MILDNGINVHEVVKLTNKKGDKIYGKEKRN